MANVAVGTDDLTEAEETASYGGGNPAEAVIPSDATNIWYLDEGTGVVATDYGTDGDNGAIDAACTWVGSGEFDRIYYAPNAIIVNTTADGVEDVGGSDVTITDATLTQAPAYWDGALVTITAAGAAAPEGETSICTAFAAGGVITVSPAFSANVDIGDEFTIEFGTLVDRAAPVQNARITWGVNPTTVAMGPLVSDSQSTPGPIEADPTTDILPPIESSDWFVPPDIGGSLATNPLRPFVTMISDNTDFTERQSWVFLGLAMVLLVTAGTSLVVNDHMLITGIAVGAAIGAMSVLTIFPLWALVYAIGAVLAGVVMERSPSL